MSETQKSLITIWTVVGCATSYITINLLFYIHGSEFFLPSIKISDTDKYSAAFYGLVFTIPLILTTHYITKIYTKKYTSNIWYKRIPIAFNRVLDDEERFLRSYQYFFFILIVLIPTFAHIDFFLKFFHGGVFLQDSGVLVLSAWEQMTFDFSIYKHGWSNFRYGDVNIGIDYYPVIMPIGIIILEIIHMLSFFTTIRCLKSVG